MVRGGLRVRQIDLRSSRTLQGPVALVTDHAHDGHPGRAGSEETDPFAEWVLSGEHLPAERLVDHHDP